jgi:hypothetical protein
MGLGLDCSLLRYGLLSLRLFVWERELEREAEFAERVE